MLKLEGPTRYWLKFDATRYRVECPNGSPRFAGNGSRRGPKLYLVVCNDWPVYVGVTRQSMGARFRYGWSAKGETGYYGYRWRHLLTEAAVDVWSYAGPKLDPGKAMREIETVEAELVYLIRDRAGQWPAHQTEIHFYPSNEHHRTAARSVLDHYSAPEVR